MFTYHLKTLQTILSGLLIVIVMMSSVNGSVSFHLCGGEMQNITVFNHPPACTGQGNACNQGSGNLFSFDQGGCCEDTALSFNSDKYIPEITRTIAVTTYQSLPVMGLVSVESPLAEVDYAHFSHYTPPLIERDITLLIQSFLI